MNPILDEIAKTSIQLMLKEPFFGHFFTGILKDVSEQTESISLSMSRKEMLKLVVNQNYWRGPLTTPDPEETKLLRYGAIKHQILHLVLKHMMRVHEFGNKRLFHLASDLSANQYINKNELTEDAITLDMFPDFKLERQQSIDYYYKQLAGELDNIESCKSCKGEDGEESEDSQDGEDGEGDDEEDEDDPNLNPSQNQLQKLMNDMKNIHIEQHKMWEQVERMTNAERKMLDAFINDAIINTMNRVKNKNYGNLPAGLQQYIDLLLESLKPNVNWRRVLRLFAASSSRTYLKNTIRKPSKRYGTTPGIKIKRKQKLLVAIDTSGSVQDDELREFFGEIYHIWKLGAEIFIVECDTDIHNKYPYKGVPPNVISGRGGTDFNAPIYFANDDYIPDAIVYFTDGYGGTPEVHPRMPILWMITGQGVAEGEWDYLPGRKVKMIRQLS